MSLEELEKKLYGLSPEDQEESSGKTVTSSPEKGVGVRTTWDKDAIGAMPPSLAEGTVGKIGTVMKAVFWLVIAVLMVAGGATYYYFSQYYKTKELVFTATAPDKVMIARPFEVSAHIENRSQSVLRDAKVYVQLPDGAVGMTGPADRQTLEERVGDVQPGGTVDKVFKVVIVKDEQSVKKFDLHFAYLPQNIDTPFERVQTVETNVGQPAVAFDFTTPQKVFNGEVFEMGMKYRNVSDLDIEAMKVRLRTPANYTFKDASVKPIAAGNNILNEWTVDRLAPQSEGQLAVKGSLEGPDQSYFEVKGQVVATFNGQEYVIDEKVVNLAIASSPLSLAIVPNENPQYVSKLADILRYKLKYRNNTDVGLNDVIVRVQLKGDMFDFATVQGSGFYDSAAKTITWNASNVPALKVIDPGKEGEVAFDVQTKNFYPIKRMFDKNFTLKVSGQIDSPTVPYNVASDRTIGIASTETKVAGDITMGATLLYVRGANPPRVEKPTVYTVKWTLKNYATDMRDVVVKSTLQPGIKWLGVMKGNAGTMPEYNDRTGEIVWKVPKVVATRGVVGSPVEASFQIEVTPSGTQMGSQVVVTSEAALSATDDFVGTPVEQRIEALKTIESIVR